MSKGPFSGRRLHFVGIGGAGMSGLALVARALGAEVTGSDREDSGYLGPLRDAGIEPHIGHAAENLPQDAEVVVSTAIPEDNPELAAGRERGAPVLHRGDLLGEVSRLKRSIAVSGAHGKTTTAAMAAHVLLETGADPAFLVGGELRSLGANARWGEGEWLVIEADESDRSFLKLAREVAVVTNAELDHHATYRSLGELLDAYEQFVRPAAVRVLGPDVELPGDAVRFGIGEGEVRAEDVELLPLRSRFRVGPTAFELRLPGMHNVLNALAALAALGPAGIEADAAAGALASYAGAARRFEEHGATRLGALVFDDYAHHPTEVRAALEAARTLDARRLVACFQPHLYSRTRRLAREFGEALALADLVCVVDVYPARERAEDYPGVSGLMVAGAAADAARGRPVWWVPSLEEAAGRLEAELRPGDVLVTIGAGDVDRVARELAAGRSAEGGQPAPTAANPA